MWRMMRADGQSSHALIDPRPEKAALIWFVNGRPLGFREFDDLDSALRWSDQLGPRTGRQAGVSRPTTSLSSHKPSPTEAIGGAVIRRAAGS